jgi:hypothetical protein
MMAGQHTSVDVTAARNLSFVGMSQQERAAVQNLKAQLPTTGQNNAAGYRDTFGFPVRHGNVNHDHRRVQAETANQIIRDANLPSNSTVVLYNKPLKPANNPFARGNGDIQPDVQVFAKTENGWVRIGKPIEIEPRNLATVRFADKDKLYKDRGQGETYTPVTYTPSR